MPQTQTGYAPVHRGELFYEVTEDLSAGKLPPIILLHAGICDMRMWDEQMIAFATKYRVVRYDLRGYGQSKTQSTEFSNRQDLLDVMNLLGIDKAVLIGASRGGTIAVDFALEFPDRVSKLITVCSGPSGVEIPESKVKPADNEFFAKMDELHEAQRWDELCELEIQAFVDGIGQPPDRVPLALRERIYAMNFNNFMRRGFDGKPAAQQLKPPAAGRLHEIHVPTLVMIGDLDPSGSIASAQYLAEHIPGALEYSIEDVAHLPNVEKPDMFNVLVMRFLEAT